MTIDTYKRYMIGYITPTCIEYFAFYSYADGTYAYWTKDPMSAAKFTTIAKLRDFIDEHSQHVCPLSVDTDTYKLTIFEIGPTVVSHLQVTNYVKKEHDKLVAKRSRALNKLTREERILLGLETEN